MGLKEGDELCLSYLVDDRMEGKVNEAGEFLYVFSISILIWGILQNHLGDSFFPQIYMINKYYSQEELCIIKFMNVDCVKKL